MRLARELPGCFACEVGTPISEIPQWTHSSARPSLFVNRKGHVDHPSCKKMVHGRLEEWDRLVSIHYRSESHFF